MAISVISLFCNCCMQIHLSFFFFRFPLLDFLKLICKYWKTNALIMCSLYDYFRYEFLHMYIGWIEGIKLEERDGTLLSWYSHAYNLHISLSFSFCYLLFSMWWLSISSPFSIFERWWNYDFVNDGGGKQDIGCVWRLTDKKDSNLFFFFFF